MVRPPDSRSVIFGCLLLSGFGAVGCGGPQPLGATGSVCFRPDDCQTGLECAPETTGAKKRVCKADLSGIVSMVDAGAMTVEGGNTAGGGAPSSVGAASGAGG